MADFLGLFGDDKSQNNNDNSSSQGTDTTTTANTQSSQGTDTTTTADTQSSQGTDTTTTANTQSSQSDGKLELHKEELDITKNSVNAGEVVLSKEVVEEQKTVDVPVMHEEVVITRKPVNNQSSNATISSDETIHIPVSLEQVDVNKYTVTTEEISASKRQVSETQQIEETLRREEAKVDTTGTVNIVSGGSEFSDINN